MEWIDDLDDFVHRWGSAREILLTLAALEQLPALPTRPRVYVVVGVDRSLSAILEADKHPVESVLVWPEAAQWLREQLLI